MTALPLNSTSGRFKKGESGARLATDVCVSETLRAPKCHLLLWGTFGGLACENLTTTVHKG
jgi:hypothetical protein